MSGYQECHEEKHEECYPKNNNSSFALIIVLFILLIIIGASFMNY